jgi:hypothetical protein
VFNALPLDQRGGAERVEHPFLVNVLRYGGSEHSHDCADSTSVPTLMA